MSSSKKTRSRQSRTRRNYPIGYGRPPEEHQFKPGQSGNKHGRPRGSKNEATIVNEILNRKIEMRQNGISRKITILEAIFLKFTEEALKGNSKAAAFILNRKQSADSSGQSVDPVLDADDQKIFDLFAQRLEEQLRKQGAEE